MILVITDGEPTAHVARDGFADFAWPPTPETIAATLAEVERCTRRGATINVFMLDDEPSASVSWKKVSRRNGGLIVHAQARRPGRVRRGRLPRQPRGPEADWLMRVAMHKFVFALHLLFAIFMIGPLVHAATTAGRGVRQGDAAAVRASARMARIYSYASILAVLAGFALLGKNDDKISQPWVWISVVLWLVAVGLVIGLLIPALDEAGKRIADHGDPKPLVGKIAASGGVVGIIFAVIVFLMVYKPGR